MQVFKKLEEISTSWQCSLQATVEWTTIQMALESNDYQNYVEWGAQEMFVKMYIDNKKFLMKNILDEAYRAC